VNLSPTKELINQLAMASQTNGTNRPAAQRRVSSGAKTQQPPCGGHVHDVPNLQGAFADTAMQHDGKLMPTWITWRQATGVCLFFFFLRSLESSRLYRQIEGKRAAS